MNQQLALEFVRQRMLQMGVKRYHFELLFLYANKIADVYKLYNEFWYLIDWTQNITITSDTTIYSNTSYGGLVLTSPPEFTGTVRIVHEINGGPVQFIRVIILES